MTILIISRNKESADPLVDALRRYDKIKIVHLSYSDLNPQLISELGGIDIVINRQNSETKDPSHFFLIQNISDSLRQRLIRLINGLTKI